MTDQPTPEEDLFPGASSTSSDAVHSPAANGGPASSSTLPLSNTAASVSTLPATGARQGAAKYVHKPTGYTWEKDEEAPGYAWKNKKAQEEMGRALENILDKDKIIGRKYGDIGAEKFRQQ